METNGTYLPRIIDAQVEQHLRAFGAVCIEGPKWCGKTWTSLHHSNSAVFLGDPAGGFQNRRLAEADPAVVLNGEVPRLIDEWQEFPPLWDAVRHEVDSRGATGQFILTGSATPVRKGIMHSGAGRIARLRMRTMSLFESGDSSGRVSLEALCRGEMEPCATGEVSLNTLAGLTVRGGWPASLKLAPELASLTAAQYLNAVISDDVLRIDGRKTRDTAKMRLLLRSLARNESTTAGIRTLARDISGNDGVEVDGGTIREYLDIFSRLFLTEDQPPFSANARSSLRISQSPKRHFADPSLACALLGMSAGGLVNDLQTFGFLFEALCERDLRICAESFGGRLCHYRDYAGNEIDAVIERPDGEWCAMEIKLGANQVDMAAEGLLRMEKKFEKDGRGRPPAVLCVLCGLSNAAYRREDGVFVVPLTALRN